MTALINQITINSKQNTFLNYISSVIKGESIGDQWSNVFTTQWGVDSSIWASFTVGTPFYGIKFPVSWESLSGTISHLTGCRFQYTQDGSNGYGMFINTANGNYFTRYDQNQGLPDIRTGYVFGVVNDNSLIRVRFTNSSLSACEYTYFGWLKDPQYATNSSQFPRNFTWMIGSHTGVATAKRVTLENQSIFNSVAGTDLLTSNPTLSCAVSTPGADATDLIIRDSTSPNNYIGQLWNMIRMPSSCVVGKIYKNTGVDPDTGVVETGRLRFWMCLGSWGTDKIGMRVYTDNIA